MKHDRIKMIFRFKAQVLFAFFPTSSVPRQQQATKKMEREGKLEEGSLRTAKNYARIHKYHPYTAVRGLIGALQHGAGIDLDVHCPTPTPPNAERQISDLQRQGALILLSDQEKAQILDKFHS